MTACLHELEGIRGPLRVYKFKTAGLHTKLGYGSLDEMWRSLMSMTRPFSVEEKVLRRVLEKTDAVFERAESAIQHRVDLLGSGFVDLGAQIDWTRDYKSGDRWPNRFHRRIKYGTPERRSDVKFPWEVSRFQWVLPLGQAYVLTGEERFAESARVLLEDWIDRNPYGYSVNWAVTMEPAIRVVSFVWLFYALARSAAWSGVAFRKKLLEAIYLHGDFVERNLEKSDVNGNHYTANAMGLVVCGAFFGARDRAKTWLESGKRALEEEIVKQVYEDGVDFEGSVAYHRLVSECFLIAAMYLRVAGLPVSATYDARLRSMAEFTAAYTRSDGSTPLWGDADDGRAIPFGSQSITDHRYLVSAIAAYLGDPALANLVEDDSDECAWLFGEAAVHPRGPRREAVSTPFRHGGFFVMRNDQDHVFIDCGPIGLAGRGGHGHNDLLSFEASIGGRRLVTDCGCFLYTSNYEERNLFRSTPCHNTPRLDGAEINRIDSNLLWVLHDDAAFRVLEWSSTRQCDTFSGAHDGYRRLRFPVTVYRRIVLTHETHTLAISDTFEGAGEHDVETPVHLFPGVSASTIGDSSAVLLANGRRFLVEWRSSEPWSFSIEGAKIAPSYGVTQNSRKLVWRRSGQLVDLNVRIQPIA